MKNLLQIIFIFLINVLLVSCSSDSVQNQMDVSQVLKQEPSTAQNKDIEQATPVSQVNSNENEEKVIISINNFGRTNPFKPFHETSLIANTGLPNLPPPPTYNPEVDPGITKLLEIKVSGILYDPEGASKSSAIINVNENDYLVHKGDLLFEYFIKDITKEKVVIKYGDNVYKAGIGEIIGEVNSDPVRGIDKRFGGSNKRISSLPAINLVTPTYLSSAK